MNEHPAPQPGAVDSQNTAPEPQRLLTSKAVHTADGHRRIIRFWLAHTSEGRRYTYTIEHTEKQIAEQPSAQPRNYTESNNGTYESAWEVEQCATRHALTGQRYRLVTQPMSGLAKKPVFVRVDS